MRHRRPPDATSQLFPGSLGQELRLEEGTLRVVEGPDRGRRFAIVSGTVRIGKDVGNDVVLADTAVSKSHLKIEETVDGHVLRDLASTNGTFLDGVRVREAFLTSGARIGLGRTVLVFEPPPPAVRVEAADRTTFGPLVGSSEAMRTLFGVLERLARTESTVLLRGETGTGKELTAEAIHLASRRAAAPLVVFDCATAHADLIESQLFGHRAGAFTGAVSDRAGAFRAAHQGTLFIDEIGELPLELQPRLLRVLERREVQPLGSDRAAPVDVRVVAASHRDLRALVRDGKFRQDLFYRLAVVEVVLPPLRERLDDLPLLVDRLLGGAGRLMPEALQALRRHTWPGNARELRNVLERARALAGGAPIQAVHLALDTEGAPAVVSDLASTEAAAIRAALVAHAWNRTRTAKALGIHRSTLIEKIARYRLESGKEASGRKS